jgi:DNA polymerase/3'-5' exonuclease PolX
MDYKPAIIDALTIMMKSVQINKETFKARAYGKVIKQIQSLPGPVHSRSDLESVTGIGEKIEEKLQELFATGKLASAERALERSPIALYDQLLKVHGIGPVKAKKLIEQHGITSIDDLRAKAFANKKLLDAAQTLGLKYYEEFLQRIPRNEMQQHEAALHEELLEGAFMLIVGSYRRGAPDSGDIDCLFHCPVPKGELECQPMYDYVHALRTKGYITEILAMGTHKCMAVCQLPGGQHRRLDLLLTPKEEIPYAMLYFTGSDKFNVEMRSKALERGWSLNEHGLTSVGVGDTEEEATKDLFSKKPPVLESEEEVMNFLGWEYVEPTERKGPESLVPLPPPVIIRRKKKPTPH